MIEIEILEGRKNAISIQHEPEVGSYYELMTQLEAYKTQVREVITHPSHCLPFLQPGRLIKISIPNPGKEPETLSFGWGVVVNFQKKNNKSKDPTVAATGPTYVVDVLIRCDPSTGEYSKLPKPCESGLVPQLLIIPCSLNSIETFSSARIKLPDDVKSGGSRNQVLKTIMELEKRFTPEKVPLLDPIKDMDIKDDKFVRLIEKMQVLESKLSESAVNEYPDKNQLIEKYADKQKVIKRIKACKKEIQQTQSIIQLEELKCRRRVLRRLGYLNEQDVIEMKGRVACEISAGDELLLTEMMFQGVFNDLTVDQTVSLLSCFTWQEKVHFIRFSWWISWA